MIVNIHMDSFFFFSFGIYPFHPLIILTTIFNDKPETDHSGPPIFLVFFATLFFLVLAVLQLVHVHY